MGGEGLRYGRIGGRYVRYGWVDGMGLGMGGGMGLRVGFINILVMYNYDGGKWGARGCEARQVKQRVALVRAPFYLINLWLMSSIHAASGLPFII